MLQLKLVEESPSISQVWVNLYCPEEPLSGFGDFALTPEQPKCVDRVALEVNTNSSIMPQALLNTLETTEKERVLYD